MPQHVIFAAPFFMEATLRFIGGATRLPGISASVVSQDPAEKMPAELRARLGGHWRVDDGLDPQQLVDAARELGKRLGPPVRYIATDSAYKGP